MLDSPQLQGADATRDNGSVNHPDPYTQRAGIGVRPDTMTL